VLICVPINCVPGARTLSRLVSSGVVEGEGFCSNFGLFLGVIATFEGIDEYDRYSHVPRYSCFPAESAINSSPLKSSANGGVLINGPPRIGPFDGPFPKISDYSTKIPNS